MATEEELAQFQAALLEILDQGLPPEKLHEALMDDDRLAPFRRYVEGFDPAMLETAAELVKKWGHRVTAKMS